jgi:hypothetical protein
VRRFLALVAAIGALALFELPAADADNGGVVIESATVNNHDVSSSTPADPIRLVPGEYIDVTLRVANRGPRAIEVRHVEFTGRVLGLVFFNYLAAVNLEVDPGTVGTVDFRPELSGLRGQAVGLIRGDVAVTDGNENRLASTPMVSDVRGSLVSVYGFFGLTVLILTALASLDAGIAIARQRLSDNRWLRGMRLLTPGIGVGMLLLFTASAFRLWVPTTHVWLTVAALMAAAFFATGYLSPTPSIGDEDDEFDDLAVLDADDDTELAADETELTPNLTNVTTLRAQAVRARRAEPTLVRRSQPTDSIFDGPAS